MALNMSTYAVKQIRFIQCIVLANQKRRYAKKKHHTVKCSERLLTFF